MFELFIFLAKVTQQHLLKNCYLVRRKTQSERGEKQMGKTRKYFSLKTINEGEEDFSSLALQIAPDSSYIYFFFLPAAP
jgi:hypothetical protein